MFVPCAAQVVPVAWLLGTAESPTLTHTLTSPSVAALTSSVQPKRLTYQPVASAVSRFSSGTLQPAKSVR